MTGAMVEFLRRRPDFGAVVIAAVLLLAFAALDVGRPRPLFFNGFTLDNVSAFGSILALIVLGQTLVLITREVDLSVGSVYGLGGIAFIILERDLGVVPSAAVVLLSACVVGFVSARLVVDGRLPSMIVTLCGLFFYRGIIYLWSGGSVPSLARDARDHWLVRLLGGEFLGVENAVIILVAVAVAIHLLLSRTSYGNQLYATGGDEPSALSRGVDTARVKTIAFVLCALLAAFAGVITIADTPNTYVTMGYQFELQTIAAAVIGGCTLRGGRGTALGAVLGALIVVAVRYELVSLGAPSSWFITFVGVLLIVAILFNRLVSRMVWSLRTA